MTWVLLSLPERRGQCSSQKCGLKVCKGDDAFPRTQHLYLFVYVCHLSLYLLALYLHVDWFYRIRLAALNSPGQENLYM